MLPKFWKLWLSIIDYNKFWIDGNCWLMVPYPPCWLFLCKNQLSKTCEINFHFCSSWCKKASFYKMKICMQLCIKVCIFIGNNRLYRLKKCIFMRYFGLKKQFRTSNVILKLQVKTPKQIYEPRMQHYWHSGLYFTKKVQKVKFKDTLWKRIGTPPVFVALFFSIYGPLWHYCFVFLFKSHL